MKKNKILISLIAIFFIIIILIILVNLLISQNNTETDEQTEKASLIVEETEEVVETNDIEKLYDMTEQERITYYCAEFFRLVDNKEYEKAYELLYYEYKENYFTTLSSFEIYMETYFPEDFSLDYTNFERLGDIYIFWIDVNDTLNGSYGHNFSMNVVIKENDYDDFVLSFSRNSAVEE